MEWYDNYNINVQHIDDQHKELVNTITRLQSALSSENPNDEIRKALVFIVEYTKYHFSDEEAIMELEGFPEIEMQRKLHKNLINDVTKLLVDLKKGKSINILELIDFLTEWFITHITKQDKQFGLFLERKRKKQAASQIKK